ncbi:hypothetical protein ABIF20_006811 [Bradyrhizobium japonicum]
MRRRRSGWPGTLPAIAGATGVLCAVSDGGGAMRGGPSVLSGVAGGTGEPGPTGRFGFGCPG